MFIEAMNGGKRTAHGVTNNISGNVATVSGLGFRPSYVMCFYRHYTVGDMMTEYDGESLKSSFISGQTVNWLELDTSSNSIVFNSDGFVFTRSSDPNPAQSFQDGRMYYVAIE